MIYSKSITCGKDKGQRMTEMQNVPIPSIFDNHGVWAEMRDLGLGWGPDRSSLTCFQEL